MAFIKKCIAEISVCIKCGNSATKQIEGQWFCPKCAESEEKVRKNKK